MKKTIVIIIIVMAAYSLLYNTAVYYIQNLNNTNTVTDTSQYDVNEIELTEIINEKRTLAGKESYIKDRYLCGWAGDRLEQVKNYFTHNGFFEGVDRVYSETKFTALAENLSMFYTSPEDTLKAWEESPEHKKNLDGDYTHSCIRCDYGYCVHLFSKY